MSEMITRSIIVKANVDEVYRAWTNFENFPMFMKNILSVQKNGDKTSHWVMEGPLGKKIEWDAETTRLEENKRVAWSSKDHKDSDITTSGQVTFNPLSNGETEINVMLQYIPKAGLAGDAVAKFFSNPEEMLEEDLKNFKAYIEGMRDRIPVKPGRGNPASDEKKG